MSGKFVCSDCGHVARDNYNLIRHKRTHARFQCRLCDKAFASHAEEKAHKDLCGKYFICFHCHRRMSNKFALDRHIKKWHATPCNSTEPRLHDFVCPLCSRRFGFKEEVESHLTIDHHKSLEKQFIVFDTEDDFYYWKADLESTTKCAFTRRRGIDRSKKNKHLSFYCFRSGLNKTKPMESRKRLPRTLGSNKINAYCPARMNVTVVENGKVEVKCVLTHLGHDFDIARLTLSKSYRQCLGMKLGALEALTGDMFFDDFISPRKGKLSNELRTVRRKHKIYLDERDLMQVEQVHCDEWIVSSEILNNLFTVHKKQKSCEGCSLRCGWCKACIHMYMCTCTDSAIKGNMCKHIHKVCSEYSAEPSCELNPSIVVERPNDISFPSTSENSDFQDAIEDSMFRETPPPSISQTRVEELSSKFQEVLKKVKNEEQYAAVKEGISSLAAAVSALKRMETV